MLEWADGRFRLASVHEGVSVEDAVAGCGFPLDTEGCVTTEPPPPEALAVLRERIDPHGLRRLETREGRPGGIARAGGALAR